MKPKLKLVSFIGEETFQIFQHDSKNLKTILTLANKGVAVISI